MGHESICRIDVAKDRFATRRQHGHHDLVANGAGQRYSAGSASLAPAFEDYRQPKGRAAYGHCPLNVESAFENARKLASGRGLNEQGRSRILEALPVFPS
jgi:hypothetical protein